jgi:uncharacterized protein
MEIEELYKRFEVPQNIISHMKKVAAVCSFLTDKITSNSAVEIKGELLLEAALVHDILKTKTANHELKGAKLFNDSVLADLIRKHRFASLIDPDINNRPQTWEEKILYYADKRVQHDKIVSISERIKDGNKRYAHEKYTLEDQRLIEEKIRELEKELCLLAGILPSNISEGTVNSVN